MPPAPMLLLTLALTACAGTAAQAPRAPTQGAERAKGTERAASRLGPPSVRGLGLRHVDRPNGTEPPIALFY